MATNRSLITEHIGHGGIHAGGVNFKGDQRGMSGIPDGYERKVTRGLQIGFKADTKINTHIVVAIINPANRVKLYLAQIPGVDRLHVGYFDANAGPIELNIKLVILVIGGSDIKGDVDRPHNKDGILAGVVDRFGSYVIGLALFAGVISQGRRAHVVGAYLPGVEGFYRFFVHIGRASRYYEYA